MKTKYIVGIAAAVVLVATAIFSVENKKIEYMDFHSAAAAQRTAQVSGVYVRENGNSYDPSRNEFRFTMRDEKGSELPVVYGGAKPNNFELSEKVVCTGEVRDGQFHASNILTKCPSKYESGESGLGIQAGS